MKKESRRRKTEKEKQLFEKDNKNSLETKRKKNVNNE